MQPHRHRKTVKIPSQIDTRTQAQEEFSLTMKPRPAAAVVVVAIVPKALQYVEESAPVALYNALPPEEMTHNAAAVAGLRAAQQRR